MSRYTQYGILLGVCVFLVVTAAGISYTFTQPVAYEAQARIWVQPKLAEMVPSSMQTSLYAPLTAFFNSPITTAGEVMRSDIVLQEALRVAKTQLPPDKLPTLDDLRGGVSITPVANADILIPHFRFRDPQACAVVLGDLLDAFILENSTQSAQSATQSRIFLEKQLKQAQEESLRTRESLKQFQDENKTVDLTEQTNHTLREMSDLKSGIEKASAGVMEERSKIRYLESQLKISPDSVVLAQRLSRDEEIKGLRMKIANDQVRYIELKSKLRDEHPRMQQLRTMLQNTKAALKERITALVGSSGSVEAEAQLLIEDPVQQKLMADMVDARASEIAQETEVESLNQALATTKAKLTQVPEQQLKLAELTRAADVAAHTLSDTERNLHSTRLLESVASKASNIQILDRPQVPMVPANSKVTFGLVASVLLGMVLGVAAFCGVYFGLDPAIRSVRGVLALVPLPLVGWIERMPAIQTQDVLPGLQRVRVNLRSWLMGPHCRIVVTSGDTEDGKTILAAGLAISLAQAGSRVCLVDGNLAHPTLHEIFGLPESPGVAEFLSTGNVALLPQMLHTVKENLQVVTAGDARNLAGSFDTPDLAKLLEHLESQSDVSIIDTPAVFQSEDAMVLMNTNSRLLVVVRLRHTEREKLRLLAAHLKQLENVVGGIILFNAEEADIVSCLLTQEAPAAEEPATSPVESTRW